MPKPKHVKYDEAVRRNLRSTNRKHPLPKNLEQAREVLGIRNGDDQWDTVIMDLIRGGGR